jgi:hypothetical protein
VNTVSRTTPPSKLANPVGPTEPAQAPASSDSTRADSAAESDERDVTLETVRAAVPSQPAPDFVDTAPFERRSKREQRLKLVLAFLSSALAAAAVTAGFIAWLSGGR